MSVSEVAARRHGCEQLPHDGFGVVLLGDADQQRPRVRAHDRVVVDVDQSGLRCDGLGDLTQVRAYAVAAVRIYRCPRSDG